MTSTRTATVLGATGLVGQALVQQLQQDRTFGTVRLLVRRPYPNNDPRLEIKLIDFADPESVKLGIDGSDAVFCTVGTTQRQVKGDLEAYRKVDYDIPTNAARYAKETGCETFAVVSAVGADATSHNFYLKLKGQMEEAVTAQHLASVHIFRPSLLLGQRTESRTGERIAAAVMPAVSFLLRGGWQKYRAINAATVAQAMIRAVKGERPGSHYYTYADIIRLAR